MKQSKLKELEDILIDFGNHYVEATQGKKLDLKHYCNLFLDINSKSNKFAELETVIDARDFIKECPNETRESIVKAFDGQIEDLKEELEIQSAGNKKS